MDKVGGGYSFIHKNCLTFPLPNFHLFITYLIVEIIKHVDDAKCFYTGALGGVTDTAGKTVGGVTDTAGNAGKSPLYSPLPPLKYTSSPPPSMSGY